MTVEVVGGDVSGRIGVASGQCLGRVMVGMVVGEMAGEEDVETVWKKKQLRYGGRLSSMRAGKYGTVKVRDGSGWRVAGVGAIVVGAEGRG